jgi:hypothetical protein
MKTGYKKESPRNEGEVEKSSFNNEDKDLNMNISQVFSTRPCFYSFTKKICNVEDIDKVCNDDLDRTFYFTKEVATDIKKRLIEMQKNLTPSTSSFPNL